jgi:hypothetical protein
MNMKKNNKWLGLITSSFLLLTVLNSCLKDRNKLATDFAKATSIVELPDAGFQALAFDISPTPTNAIIYVNLAGPVVADKDIPVTLALDPAGLADYNTANGTSYTMLPDSAFTVPSFTVTIKKGQRLDSLVFSVFSSKVDLTVSNALAFKITDASGLLLSENNKSVIYAVVVKNEWDADYAVTGWFFHPAAGRAIDATKHLSTITGIRMEGGIGDLGSPFQFDIVNNQLENWFSDAFTSTGFMTADNPGGTDYSDPSNEGHVPGDATFNKTIYNNTYDPATKTFYMHYGYRAGVVTDQTGYTRQIYEKWVRK